MSIILRSLVNACPLMKRPANNPGKIKKPFQSLLHFTKDDFHRTQASNNLKFSGQDQSKEEDEIHSCNPAIIQEKEKTLFQKLENGVSPSRQETKQLIKLRSLIDDESALHLAFKERHAKVAQLLIKSGADVNAKTKNGVRVLQVAISAELWNEVIMLLDHGAKPNNCRGFNPLFHVVDLEDTEPASRLIKAGAMVNARNDKGWTVLDKAILKENWNLASLLLDHAATTNRTTGWNPLFSAVLQENTEGIKDILEKNRNEINVPTNTGLTVLELAIKKENPDFVERLLQENADPNIKNKKSGKSPLHHAIFNGNKEIFDTLLQHGADVNARDGKGWSVLDKAILNLDGPLLNKDLTFVRRLIKNGADPTNVKGLNPLFIAIEPEDIDLAERLIKKGANVNGVNKEGFTVLDSAISMKNWKLVRRLSEKGADPSRIKGWNPLFDAVCSENIREAHALIKKGDIHLNQMTVQEDKDISEAPQLGVSVLHVASSLKNEYLVKLLLENNADANAVDGKDVSVLISAILNADLDKASINIVKMLLEHNAEPNKRDAESKKSPLYFAVSCSEIEIARLLINNGANTTKWSKHYDKIPFLAAIEFKGKEMVQIFLDDYKNPEKKLSPEQWGIALYQALTSKNYRNDIIQLLLENGADIHTKFKINNYLGRVPKGFTEDEKSREVKPLEYTLSKLEDTKMGTFLVECNALKDESYSKKIINAKDFRGQTMLHHAASAGNSEVVRTLLQAGSDPEIRDTIANMTAQDYAIEKEHTEISKLLSNIVEDSKKKKAISIPTRSGTSPLSKTETQGSGSTRITGRQNLPEWRQSQGTKSGPSTSRSERDKLGQPKR